MKLSGVSFFKKTPKGLRVSFGRSGVTRELDWVGVASNCTMGLFWGRHLFFDWPLRDCKGNWVKLRPKQTVPWCNGLQSSRPRKSSCPKLCRPKFLIKLPEILSRSATSSQLIALVSLREIFKNKIYYSFDVLVFRLIKTKRTRYVTHSSRLFRLFIA